MATLSSVYLGIDVACGAGKQLPVCFVSAGRQIMPLPIPKHLGAMIPRGAGNTEIASAAPFRQAALGVVGAIGRIAHEMGWRVERAGIDAPAAVAVGPRASENALARAGLSCFRTPAVPEWADIRTRCADHLRAGRGAATLPHANKIWMLFGFELFAALRTCLPAEAIEVYPFAIVRALLPRCQHKSTEQGYQDQLGAVAARTGWEPRDLEAKLKATVPGRRHDRLDAFMAAWVASLPADRRHAFGDSMQPDDAIWVPRSHVD